MLYLQIATMATFYMHLAITVVGLVMGAFSFFDALRRPQEAFMRAGLQEKSKWLMLTGGSLAASLFSLLLGGRMILLALIAMSIAGVYLAGPRREMNLYSR